MGVLEGRKIISSETVEIIGKYTIVKTREKAMDMNGKPFGRIQTWFDICLDDGNGDIVASYRKLKDARRWTKEN